MSRLDFDFVTIHTPANTSSTANPWLHFTAPMPMARLTMTATNGCT